MNSPTEHADSMWFDGAGADPYNEEPPSDADVLAVEQQLGFRLPPAYVELAKTRNGGILRRDAYPTSAPTSWADDHVAIDGIYAIGSRAMYSLCGPIGQATWLDEWGYPPIGVYFATTPSAGHDMLVLDYRRCGSQGEPAVAHIDQERDYRITVIAESFSEFVQGLVVGDEAFPD